MSESAGKAISPIELKTNIGRGTVLRPSRGKGHQGQRSDPTAFEALKRAATGEGQKPPAKLEMELLSGANPSTVRVYRAAGFTDQQIYEMLNT